MRRCDPRPLATAILLCAAVFAAACSGSIDELGGLSPAPAEVAGPAGDGEPAIGDGAPIGESRVYAHTASDLFAVDPDTLAVTHLGAFGWPGVADEMTDLAVDRSGSITGISFDRVYRVDPTTLACTELAPLAHPFVGLSYVTSELEGGAEQLVATASSGEVFRIDPASGASTPLGAFGAGIGSSGDLVSVKHLGTLATVVTAAGGNDWLARIDPRSGSATLIGDTGFAGIWGLGFWKDKVYGFTEAAQFVLLDPASGRATLVSAGGGGWWGAGVTTSAPVIR